MVVTTWVITIVYIPGEDTVPELLDGTPLATVGVQEQQEDGTFLAHYGYGHGRSIEEAIASAIANGEGKGKST